MKTQVKNKIKINPKPQFGLSQNQWNQLKKKATTSLVPMIREALIKTYKLSAE